MHSTRRMSQKRNLLLGFDAFGTLFYPKEPVFKQYGHFAERHGIKCSASKISIKDTFKTAFKEESSENPNYGKATGQGAEKWWANVITKTFRPFLNPGQQVPQALINDLLTQFSTRAGYALYPDVLPFFQMLREKPAKPNAVSRWHWDNTVVGIITNSDSRVPSILESFGLTIGPRRIGSSEQRNREASITDDVSFVVLSYDVGYEKPDPRVFHAATQMLEETLSETSVELCANDFEKLYVGDSFEKDYLGAKGAGWNAVLLDRELQDDNLKDSPGVRSPVAAAGMDAVVMKDLRALVQWSPGAVK